MAINLRSDNRVLTQNSKYSYLVDNYPSGVGSVTIVNTEGFAADNMILIEDIGKETAEIFRIGSVNATTGLITLLTAAGASANTKFSHAESVKVYVLPYDQIRFFYTALVGGITDETPTYDANAPLTSWTTLEPAAWHTTYADTLYSTGFGWFVYRNSVTLDSSQTSNPIPYVGFAGNTVAQVFADFDSMMNTNELHLVTMADKFSWLNEAIAVLKNKLNLNNTDYFVSSEQSLSIISGTAEYILPTDFSDLVYINDGSTSKTPIPFMDIRDAASYIGNITYYSLRGRYIRITPTPTTSTTYKYGYQSKATTVTSLSTYIDIPSDGFYALKDHMLFRAYSKFGNPMAQASYQSFINNVNLYIQATVKRTNDLARWGIVPESNV